MNIEAQRLNFDPRKETRYLKQFDRVTRKQQLEREIETSLAELLLSEYSHDYLWDGVEIVDKNTGIRARKLSENCEFESQRIGTVEDELKKGNDLVVSVSPRNIKLDYPDDMVDFWKLGEGNKLTLMRFKVDMGQAELNNFEAINKKDYSLADLIRMLNLAKESKGVSMALIEGVARDLTSRFEREYGERIFVDAEIMTRLYVAIRLEVEEQSSLTGIVIRGGGVKELARIKDYLYGQLTTKKVAGAGCGGSSLSGQFAKEGIIIINTADGINFRKGSTEGLTYCSRCGCWYSGEKCPVCK